MKEHRFSRRQFLRLSATAIAASTLAACGPTPTPTPLPKPITPPAPAVEKSVTLYVVHGPEMYDPVLAPFIKANPDLKVNIIAMPSTGEGISRVKAEKDNPLADVFWGGAAEFYQADAALFNPIKLDGDANMVVQDKNNVWHASDLLFQTIGVSTTRLPNKAEWPKTFKELADPKWKGKGRISYANPRRSGTGYSLLASMVTLYGWSFVTEFLKNCLITDSSTAMFNNIRGGETVLGFFNEDLAIKWKNEGAPVDMIFTDDGVSNQVGCCAMIKGAKHPVAAKLLLEYILSKDAQTIMSTVVQRRPAHKDVPAPGGLPAAGTLKLIQYDFTWLSAEKEDTLKKFDDARSKAGV